MKKTKTIYHVEHPHTSGGPTFTSLTEALAYIKNGNHSMTIWSEHVYPIG